MKHSKWASRICAGVLVSIVLAGAALAAGGTQTDPLVTLSYLNDVFAPQVEEDMEAMVSEKADELAQQFDQAISQVGSGGASVFSVVTLSDGQTLVGDVGCEVMLRIGSAVCGSDGSTGLIDVTDGSTLSDGGDLVTNHLYMVTISTRSVTATAGTTKLLVRGPYTIQ